VSSVAHTHAGHTVLRPAHRRRAGSDAQVTPPVEGDKKDTDGTPIKTYYMMHGRIEVPVSIEISIQMTPGKPITIDGKSYDVAEPTTVYLPVETATYVVFVQSLKIIDWINYKLTDARTDGNKVNANPFTGAPGVLKPVA
jgi:hypothetical protein